MSAFMSASYSPFPEPGASAGTPPPAKVLVLGLGNDILTDDAIGLYVAQAVLERFDASGIRGIDVVATCEMGLALLDIIVGHDDLVLIDAVQTGRRAAGTIHELAEGDLRKMPGMSPHFLGVGEILALGRELGLKMPTRVRILAVEVQDPFTLGTALTPALRHAMPAVVERVVNLALHWSLGHSGGRALPVPAATGHASEG